jgi:hypothetical protein
VDEIPHYFGRAEFVNLFVVNFLLSKVIEMKKVHTMGDYAPPANDRRFVGLEDVVHYQTIVPLRHLSFDNISSIQFCVDGARGLPASVTATRVTARLLSHDRTQVGEPSAPSHSNPDSDARNPLFDLHMGWRGNVLIPSVTVVCRIDTLEKPSLLPKCVGFAVMKLCVDMNGKQPKPEMHPEDRVYLNAGQYLLPIVYGTVPTDGPFTEELMDSLPHVHEAYLAVRLFDPSVEVPNPPPEIEYMPYSGHPDFGKYVVDNSVAGSIVHAMPYSDPSVRKIPISEFILDEIMRGEEIGEGEKRVVLRQCIEWMAVSFPPLKSKLPLIDSRFILPYEDKFGVFCALDMLFQMPQKPSLLGVTKRSLGKQTMFQAKKYDNKIRYYKTYFRYLPGFIPKKHGGKGQPKEETLADMVIDDASLEPNLASPEHNLIFNDDFSRTVGIELTQNACLLMVVSAVDILTSEALASGSEQHAHSQSLNHHSQSYGAASLNNSPSRNGRGGNINGFATPEEHFRRTEEEKGFKLRGLRGIYFNENHVDGNGVWWGIVPLLIESPFEKDAHGNRVTPAPIFSPMKALKAAATVVIFASSSKLTSNNSDNSLENGEALSMGVVKKLKDISSGLRRSNSSKKMLAELGRSKSANRIALKRGNSGMGNWVEVNDNDMNVMDISRESSFRDSKPTTHNHHYSNNKQEESLSRVATGKSTGRSSKNGKQGKSSAVVAAVAQAAMDAQKDIMSINNGHWFVNSGTHQIPLFQGLPPEELFLAANPMAWVMAQLAHLPSPTELAAATAPVPHATSVLAHQYQLQQQKQQQASASWLGIFGGCHGTASTTEAVVPPPVSSTKAAFDAGNSNVANTVASPVKRVAGGAMIAGGTTASAQPVVASHHKETTFYQLQLVPGCSAFISIIDPRLRAFSHDSVARDANVPLRMETIEKLLRAQLLRHMKYFQSNSNKAAGRQYGRHLAKNLHPNAMKSANRAVYAAEEEERFIRMKLQKAFQFDFATVQRLSRGKRSYEAAIPPSILVPTLVQEINHHFMEIISESD